MDEMVNHYNDGGWHIQSFNVSNEVTQHDTMYSDQIDMICLPDEVASFNSIANAQTDMICQYYEVVNFDSIPGNQNDSFLSLFLLFFQNFYFLTFDFEIRGCVMFSNTS